MARKHCQHARWRRSQTLPKAEVICRDCGVRLFAPGYVPSVPAITAPIRGEAISLWPSRNGKRKKVQHD